MAVETDPSVARHEVIVQVHEEMMALWEKLTKEHNLNLIEMFMVGHNVHKDSVLRCARIMSLTGGDRWKIYRDADLTFRSAMRDLKRDHP